MIPLNLTEVLERRFVPVRVTAVPTAPRVGEKEPIAGTASTVKLVELAALPTWLVTVIAPVVAPGGTTAVRVVSEVAMKVEAEIPLNLTAVVPVNPVPAKVKVVPIAPMAGEKVVIAGSAKTVKLLELIPVPTGLVTEILPVVVPIGTTAVREVFELI